MRQHAKQLAVALEEAAQDARDGKGPVAVGDGSENLACELFGKEDGALGLATGAEIPGAAGKGQKVFGMALRTPDAGETSLKPATGQELFYGTNYHRAQWSRAGFEAFFITSDVTVEVVFEKLVNGSLLGMSRPILRGGF